MTARKTRNGPQNDAAHEGAQNVHAPFVHPKYGFDIRTHADVDPSNGKPRPAVYFVQCGGERGPVKIGTARNITGRFHDLQMGCPYGLRLLAARPGDRETERKLHSKFYRARIRGEWFEWCPEIAREVEIICRRWKFPLLNNWQVERPTNIVPFTARPTMMEQVNAQLR
jgi:hypothetical protein